MTRVAALALGAALVIGTTPPVARQPAPPRQPSLRDVLSRAGDYVVSYGDNLASVIADEDYLQRIVTAAGEVVAERRLRSEIAFVRLAGSTEWQAFRDVLAVDGRPVAVSGRLTKVLEGARQSIFSQARAIAAESARYNLGPLTRTFNAPTTSLQFLHPAHRERFSFARKAIEPCDGESCWIVEVKERPRNTLIRDANGRDLPLSGRLTIGASTGRVTAGMFSVRKFLPGDRKKDESSALMDVVWRPEPNLAVWVPSTMRERYAHVPIGDDASGAEGEILGEATYTSYRRFVVDVRIR